MIAEFGWAPDDELRHDRSAVQFNMEHAARRIEAEHPGSWVVYPELRRRPAVDGGGWAWVARREVDE